MATRSKPQAPAASATPVQTTPAVVAQPAKLAAEVYAAQPWAPTLPKSLNAKGAGLLGAPKGLPSALQGVRLLPGKPYAARSAHNAAWAALAVATCAKAGAAGAPVVDVLAAGVGLHSVVAYVQRGWLVRA